MSKNSVADKKKPDIELKGKEAQEALQAQQQNPFAVIAQTVNNHAQKIKETINSLESIAIDVKTSKANMEIFDKRFGLVERQLDNIERELSRIQKILIEK